MEKVSIFREIILKHALAEQGHPTRSFHPTTLDEYFPDPEGRWNCAEFVTSVTKRACDELGLEPPKLIPFTRWLFNTNLGGLAYPVDNGLQLPGDIAVRTNAMATTHIGIVAGIHRRPNGRNGYMEAYAFDLIHSPGKDDGEVIVDKNIKRQSVRVPVNRLNSRRYSHNYHFLRPAVEDPETLWRHESICIPR